MGLFNHETGEPVVGMTRLEYICLWAVALIIGIVAARIFLVQPIVDALHR